VTVHIILNTDFALCFCTWTSIIVCLQSSRVGC